MAERVQLEPTCVRRQVNSTSGAVFGAAVATLLMLGNARQPGIVETRLLIVRELSVSTPQSSAAVVCRADSYSASLKMAKGTSVILSGHALLLFDDSDTNTLNFGQGGLIFGSLHQFPESETHVLTLETASLFAGGAGTSLNLYGGKPYDIDTTYNLAFHVGAGPDGAAGLMVGDDTFRSDPIPPELVRGGLVLEAAGARADMRLHRNGKVIWPATRK